jgi:AcrR family transcriptional regulator
MARPRTVADDAVLDAAVRLIGRVGPARLTLARVGEEVGLSPATLLQRFGSKRGLLLAVARRPVAFRTAGPTRLEALIAGLIELSAAAGTPEALANYLAFLQLDLSDAEFHAEAVAHFTAMREHVEALLAGAVGAGELAVVDVPDLAATVITTYNGALITWAVLREGTLEDWLRRQIEAVLAPYVEDPHAPMRSPVSSVE